MPPSDVVFRWNVQNILQMTRRGGYATGSDWFDFLDRPRAIYPKNLVPFELVLPMEEEPDFRRPAGIELQSYKVLLQAHFADKITIFSGKRKGFQLDLSRRKNAIKIPVPSAKPKYSVEPNPLLKLDHSAVPSDASEKDWLKAIGFFSCSIASSTQANYASAIRKEEVLLCTIAQSLQGQIIFHI